jgi:hypothetical protein
VGPIHIWQTKQGLRTWASPLHHDPIRKWSTKKPAFYQSGRVEAILNLLAGLGSITLFLLPPTSFFLFCLLGLYRSKSKLCFICFLLVGLQHLSLSFLFWGLFLMREPSRNHSLHLSKAEENKLLLQHELCPNEEIRESI